MSDEFMFLPLSIQKRKMIMEIEKCNEYTSRYGLQLSEEEINFVAENRRETLINNGRLEFGEGAIQKIIMEFADSPHIYQDNYVNTLLELQECFYYFKNESEDELTDDELIHIMKYYFDHECQGSLEYLQSTVMENICHDVRFGYDEYENSDGYDNDYSGFSEYEGEGVSYESN